LGHAIKMDEIWIAKKNVENNTEGRRRTRKPRLK
jgi:hypothetical protein